MALKLTAAHIALLTGILSGATTHVAKSAEIDALVKEGFAEVNPAMLDTTGNAVVRLTEKGTEEARKHAAPVGTAPASAPLFSIAAVFELPPIKRGGNTSERASKYPLKDIPLGGALFIAAAEGKTAKNMSKQFGSMVADFNKENPDKYLTSRTIEDGKAFGEQFAGKPGIAIASRPVAERKERKPRAPKTETAIA